MLILDRLAVILQVIEGRTVQMSTLAETLQRLPDEPGVYIMKDGAGTIIYVGKAISLKKRVRQYFNKDKNKHPKVVALVSHIASIEYIIVDNEVEALILESNFIKENRPHYNVLLRDDKQYPYIKVTNEKFPKIGRASCRERV